jgi:hypothetical protein
MTSKFTDEELMAYVDGEVDDAKAAAIEAAAAANPGIARTIDLFARSRLTVQEAYASVLHEPVPPHLVASALGRPAAEGNVVAFPSRWPSTFAIALAAAACLAIMISGVAGYFAWTGTGGVGGIGLASASPEISGLLGTAPSGAEETLADGSAFHVVGSFHDRNERFCREFEVSGEAGGSLAVACRTDSDWSVEFAMRTGTAGGYEPASSTAVLDSYLAQIGAGEILSSDEERRLLDEQTRE